LGKIASAGSESLPFVFVGLIFFLSIVYMLFVQGHLLCWQRSAGPPHWVLADPRDGGQQRLLVMSSSGQQISSTALSSTMAVATVFFIRSSSLML
jgi:hypothetical protein